MARAGFALVKRDIKRSALNGRCRTRLVITGICELFIQSYEQDMRHSRNGEPSGHPKPEGMRDTEFIACMRSERIVGHQLFGDLFREGRRKPARSMPDW